MSKKKVTVTLQIDEEIYREVQEYLVKTGVPFDEAINELIRQMILHKQSVKSGLITGDKQSSWFFPSLDNPFVKSDMSEEDMIAIQDFLEILKYN